MVGDVERTFGADDERGRLMSPGVDEHRSTPLKQPDPHRIDMLALPDWKSVVSRNADSLQSADVFHRPTSFAGFFLPLLTVRLTMSDTHCAPAFGRCEITRPFGALRENVQLT
jgi:hypothetical protein